ncbi:hypothetical protein MTQ01_12055 [Streptomyces sp. XM4193]|uniref:hypothetical protein n=1 Tax=Streptomyces sp. XM4193 TaxID=2929782 RepID=UPI001FF82BAF|nr:hypothetical protein [Streptomyces sp. XM4193]MCK1796736.1 hypothetical protein [Streptomyces sp. XM4193]
MRRSQLKLAAVVGLVVLVLSGFTPAKRSGGGGDGGDGGGCGKDGGSSNSSSTSSGTDGGSSTTSVGGTGGSKPRPTTSITECIGQSGNAATVRITAPSGFSRSYTLKVTFLNSTGDVVTSGEQYVSLEGSETRSVKVPARDTTMLDQVTECRLDPVR